MPNCRDQKRRGRKVPEKYSVLNTQKHLYGCTLLCSSFIPICAKKVLLSPLFMNFERTKQLINTRSYNYARGTSKLYMLNR